MDRRHKLIVFLLVLSLTAGGVLCSALAAGEGHRKKHRYQKRERRHSECNGKRNPTVVSDPVYTENCGACHIAYHPGLLPSGSWEKILAGLADHCGELIEIDSESAKKISAYLNANAANHSSTGLAAKIMQGLGNQLPQRITEVPYVRKKHRKISNEILKRKSIGTLSNCSACHAGAANGNFEDDDVVVPR